MESGDKTMEIEFFIPEEERPNNDDKYKIGLWKIDGDQALIRLKLGQKISTDSGNQYAFNFCVKPGMLTKDLFAISIPHL